MTRPSRVSALIRISLTIACGLVLLPSVLLAADTSVVPSDRRTVWNPGIPGGIPGDADPTRPATVWVPAGNPYGGYSVDPALGDGTSNATTAINNAITSAGSAARSSSRRIVFLAPGQYRTNGVVRVGRSYVTLRGSGQGVTIVDHRTTSDGAAIFLGNTVSDFSSTPVVNVTGGAVKGAAQITVANASGFNVGDILQIDQLADGTPNGPSGWVWILDSWWSMRSPYANYSGGGGLQGKFPDSPNGYRPISQRIEVLAKNGNTLTIYDPSTGRGSPLHVDFPASQDPEVWLAAGAGATPVRYAGLESLSVWSAAASGDAKDMVVMNGAAYSWIRNIETDGSRNTWAGRHIHIVNAVYRAEIRESYAHNSSNYNQGANAYGILYSGSECLIEDNIVRELNKPVVGETSGGGNVIAYNYVDEAVIGSLTNSWQETAINMSHGSFCHSDLFEGNYTPNVGVDSTHGNSGWGVFFRNYATGRNSSGRTNTYLRAIYVDGWQREMTSIGNVLGSPSFNANYLILSPATGVNPVYNGPRSIYLLGSNAWVLGSGNKPGADNWDDGQAEELFYRHLDYDYKTKAQYHNPSNSINTLPNSLYLDAKPAFFGSLPWPWVDPTGATDPDRVKTLPAKARYDAMVGGTQ
jgi:Pectate lyase superfamily protein